MLTADHCGGTGEAWRSGQASGSWPVGTLQSGNSGGSDIRRLGGQSYQGNTYAGNYNTDEYITMKGAYYAVTGDIVCPSGSYSGLNCDARVQSTNDVICYLHGSCYNNLVTVVSISNSPLFGNGDSGGPIIVGAIGGGALGTGIISGINTQARMKSPATVWQQGAAEFAQRSATLRTFVRSSTTTRVGFR